MSVLNVDEEVSGDMTIRRQTLVWKYSLNGIAEPFRHQKNGYTGDHKTNHKNAHGRVTCVSQEHIQVQKHITRTHRFTSI